MDDLLPPISRHALMGNIIREEVFFDKEDRYGEKEPHLSMLLALHSPADRNAAPVMPEREPLSATIRSMQARPGQIMSLQRKENPLQRRPNKKLMEAFEEQLKTKPIHCPSLKEHLWKRGDIFHCKKCGMPFTVKHGRNLYSKPVYCSRACVQGDASEHSRRAYATRRAREQKGQ